MRTIYVKPGTKVVMSSYLRQSIKNQTEEAKNIRLGDLWRYSINEGEFGGIVVAKNLNEATEKVVKKYKDGKTIDVWTVKNDDFYDEKNKDVIECYGIGGR